MKWPGLRELIIWKDSSATVSCKSYISISREFLHKSARINYGIFVNNHGMFTGFRTFRRPRLLETSSKVFFLMNLKDRFHLNLSVLMKTTIYLRLINYDLCRFIPIYGNRFVQTNQVLVVIWLKKSGKPCKSASLVKVKSI